MKEHSICCTSSEVQAILAGRKTQMRKVVKPQPGSGVRLSVSVQSGLEDGHGREIKCPYAVGDHLWVKEAWVWAGGYVRYAATDDIHELRKVRSPALMPRWASRITLEITDVRVERLWAITEEDAKAEGFSEEWAYLNAIGSSAIIFYTVDAFAAYWSSINAKRPGCTWLDDPWVWVVNFKRVEE
jgi:hypothetical protein